MNEYTYFFKKYISSFLYHEIYGQNMIYLYRIVYAIDSIDREDKKTIIREIDIQYLHRTFIINKFERFIDKIEKNNDNFMIIPMFILSLSHTFMSKYYHIFRDFERVNSKTEMMSMKHMFTKVLVNKVGSKIDLNDEYYKISKNNVIICDKSENNNKLLTRNGFEFLFNDTKKNNKNILNVLDETQNSIQKIYYGGIHRNIKYKISNIFIIRYVIILYLANKYNK